MDQFHRTCTGDTPTSRPCAFCQQSDVNFDNRSQLDQLVVGADKAAAHITEEGHIRHRLAELRLLRSRVGEVRRVATRVA